MQSYLKTWNPQEKGAYFSTKGGMEQTRAGFLKFD